MNVLLCPGLKRGDWRIGRRFQVEDIVASVCRAVERAVRAEGHPGIGACAVGGIRKWVEPRKEPVGSGGRYFVNRATPETAQAPWSCPPK
jgi:hypothetical protein